MSQVEIYNDDDWAFGIIVNPKSGVPFHVTKEHGGSYIRIRAQDGRSIGDGYLDDGDSDYSRVAEATGCPRTHTPGGVRERGGGYGTVLYSALALWAHAGLGETCVSSAGDWSGGRSSSARHWWDAAVDRGFAERVQHSITTDGEEWEESIDALDMVNELTYGQRGRLGIPDGDIHRTRPHEVEVTGQGEESTEEVGADVLHIESVMTITVAWWDPFDGETPDDAEANRDVLFACDFRRAGPAVKRDILAIAKARGWEHDFNQYLVAHEWLAAMEEFGSIAEDEDDPVLIANAGVSDAVLADIAEKRRRLGWDVLAELP